MKNLGLTVINIRSIKNKDINLDHLVENKTDICIVTETWLNEDDNTWLECCDLSKNGCQIHSANRKNRRGGGLAIISTINMKIKLLEKGDKSSFEYAMWKVNMNNSSMILLAIYHPPPSQTNHSTHPVFLDEFADYMEFFLMTNNIVIAGDCNLHIGSDKDHEAQLFIDMMAALGLDCHVDFPTHENGHSLDLVFTEILGEMKIIRCNPGTHLSDHCTIECLLSLKKGQMQKKEIRYRKLGLTDPKVFSQHLNLEGYKELSLDGMVEVLDNNLQSAIDKLGPIKCRTILVRATNPWFNNEI